MASDLQHWNSRVIAEFRANAGFVRWSTQRDLASGRPVPPLLPGFERDRGVPIILVNHTGAVTGRRRTNPLMYQPVGEAFAVFATYGGSPRPPAWYHNIRKNPRVTIEVGSDVAPASARIAHGPERERIWGEQVRLMPAFADFQAAARRQIPVVMLQRMHDNAELDPS